MDELETPGLLESPENQRKAAEEIESDTVLIRV
jgi:hypothetical protein